MNAITESLIPCSEKEIEDYRFHDQKICENKCDDNLFSVAEAQYCTTTKDIETKVFQHNTAGGLFSSLEEALNKNPDNPDADLFSILDQLENFRNQDGNFHLKLCYPEVNSNGGFCNEWIQTSNPATEIDRIGFQAISLSFPKNGANNPWRGLGLNRCVPGRQCHGYSNRTLISDSPSNRQWNGAIGATHWSEIESGVIPGPESYTVSKVVLSVFTKENNSKEIASFRII